MVFQQFLAKVRHLQIRIRKAVNADMHGNFRSVFKGSGLEFADLREYQYGDDVRHIDWNISSKGHGTFVKIFHEEKEQTIFFLIDVSGSQQVGQLGADKLAATKEICSALTLSAIQDASYVGMLCFSDKKERYLRPSHGLKQGYAVISELYKLQPTSTRTNLSEAILLTFRVLLRRSLVIMVSDFLDEGYEKNLKALALKHDLILIHLQDKRETALPKLGIVPTIDPETRRIHWVNTSSLWFRRNVQQEFSEISKKLQTFAREYDANYIVLDPQEDYVAPLQKLFRSRRMR
jgi:uncharacterized protein (DUF58 family)